MKNRSKSASASTPRKLSRVGVKSHLGGMASASGPVLSDIVIIQKMGKSDQMANTTRITRTSQVNNPLRNRLVTIPCYALPPRYADCSRLRFNNNREMTMTIMSMMIASAAA